LKTPFNLSGKVALVTGGGTGIGFAIAKALLECNAQVVIMGRREEVLQHATTVLGEKASYMVHDVTKFSQSEAKIAHIIHEHKKIDILVNNAGNHLKQEAMDMTAEDLLSVFNVHITGAFLLSKYVARNMKVQGGGSIIFIGSMTSLFGIPYVTAYSTAKTAMLGLIRTLTTEWSPWNIRINMIAPGWIDTAMSRNAFEGDPKRKEKVLGRTPMGRLGQPDEIGYVAAFLASPSASFITGTCIPVDGGASIGF